MSILKKKEIKSIAPEELDKKLIDLKKDLMKLNSQKSTGTTPKNTKEIRNIKRTIAKILTLLHSKKEKSKKGVTK